MINGLGERLQEQRTTHKLSQREVALALNVSPTVISNYEKGERTPSLEMLIALARFYHCSTDYLVGFEKPNANTKALRISFLSNLMSSRITLPPV